MVSTFKNDHVLPNLSVPKLHNTIIKYLDSVKAVASDKEFINCYKVCQEFLQNEALYLQRFLKKKASNSRNWVEDIWLNNAYLSNRSSLVTSNFSGVTDIQKKLFLPKSYSQVERSAFSLHLLGSYWNLLRREHIPAHTTSKYPLCMNQYKNCFNVTRVPGKNLDEIHNYFKLERQDSCPGYSIVLHNKKIFKIDLVDDKGNVHTVEQFMDALKLIKSDRSVADVGIAAMTSLPRDKWADARKHLLSLSEENLKNLHQIESAVHVLCLDSATPTNLTDIMRNCMTGDSTCRWRDKSYNEVWSENGVYSAHCDHSPVDGMVFVTYIAYMTSQLKSCGGDWKKYKHNKLVSLSDKPSKVKKIVFDYDEKILQAIKEGEKTTNNFNDEIDVEVVEFKGVGTKDLRKYNINSSFFVQAAIQLAYMRVHNKIPSTYETASARKFYHGRTETMRTCTPEMVEFCRKMLDCDAMSEDVHECLLKAHKKYKWLMRECVDNRGCDRHLFGLQIQALSENKTPAIFTNEMYHRTGGGGNFDLSTSFVGNFNSTGAVAPMKNDGYGFFYRINNHSVTYSMLSWKKCKQTDCDKMILNLHENFEQIFKIIVNFSKSKSESKL